MGGAERFVYGFRTEHRLHKTDEFSSVFAFRRSVRGAYFRISFRPNGYTYPRLGLIVAKRMAKRAVHRNLIKRLIREAFRYTQGKIGALDLVVQLSRPLESGDRSALRSELDSLLAKVSGCASC